MNTLTTREFSDENDYQIITTELTEKIAKAHKDLEEGKCVEVRSHEEIDRFLHSL